MDSFGPKQPSEAYYISFDFTSVVGPETLATIVSLSAIDQTTLRDVSGSLFDSTQQVLTSPIAYAWARAGVSGTTYLVTCKVRGTAGSVYELEGLLPVADIPKSTSGGVVLNFKLGDSKANSYVSTTFANTYFTSRGGGISRWTSISTTASKEAYLEQACIELDMNNFVGNKYYTSQSLQFPRNDHVVYTGACASPGRLSFKGSNLWSSEYNAIPTDYFKDGTVHITYGTNKGDTRAIASSNRYNGMVHVTENFTATLDTTSNYLIFAPINTDIQRAQCEQVIYNLNSDLSKYLEFKSQGISGVQIGDVSVNLQKYGNSPVNLNILGFFAKRYLSRFLRKDIKVSRA